MHISHNNDKHFLSLACSNLPGWLYTTSRSWAAHISGRFLAKISLRVDETIYTKSIETLTHQWRAEQLCSPACQPPGGALWFSPAVCALLHCALAPLATDSPNAHSHTLGLYHRSHGFSKYRTVTELDFKQHRDTEQRLPGRRDDLLLFTTHFNCGSGTVWNPVTVFPGDQPACQRRPGHGSNTWRSMWQTQDME